jgi:hypothetical protein
MSTESDFNIKVSCYAGYRGEQTPRSFVLWDKELLVEEVLDQWLDPEYRYFKLKASDGATYILRHDCNKEDWKLTMFSKIPL